MSHGCRWHLCSVEFFCRNLGVGCLTDDDDDGDVICDYGGDDGVGVTVIRGGVNQALGNEWVS